jgi:hypothetical protein
VKTPHGVSSQSRPRGTLEPGLPLPLCAVSLSIQSAFSDQHPSFPTTPQWPLYTSYFQTVTPLKTTVWADRFPLHHQHPLTASNELASRVTVSEAAPMSPRQSVEGRALRGVCSRRIIIASTHRRGYYMPAWNWCYLHSPNCISAKFAVHAQKSVRTGRRLKRFARSRPVDITTSLAIFAGTRTCSTTLNTTPSCNSLTDMSSPR